jgi:hypothetical protein
MSERVFAGQTLFSMYQRSTAALIVALLWLLTLALAVSLETATRGTMIAAMIPRIVTTANNSISEKADRLPFLILFIFLPLSMGTAQFVRQADDLFGTYVRCRGISQHLFYSRIGFFRHSRS